MTAYYNEIAPYAAQWLRNLIDGGHIAPGDVDERSIVDVRAADLRGYTQCHFFAGIGGWSLALRLAGWSDDRPVWTGSCPCQPFSAAGAGKAADDERHLWPAWFSLIAECRPPVVYGEQVEAAIGWGWLDAVYADLEAEGYACGAAVLPACSVGAPHIRNRVWFVANDCGERREMALLDASGSAETNGERQADISGMRGTSGELGDASGGGLGEFGHEAQPWRADEPRRRPERRVVSGRPGAVAGFWHDADWIACTDGKARPVGPGSFPLGHGIRNRPSKLRAYGNAIVPQVAAEFIMSTLPVTSPHAKGEA